MSNTVAELDIRPMSRSALGEGLSRMDRTQKTRLGLGALALLATAPKEYAFNFTARDDDDLCAVEQRWRVGNAADAQHGVGKGLVVVGTPSIMPTLSPEASCLAR